MKLRNIILVVLMLSGSLNSWATWEPYGPDSLTANKICFLLDIENHWGICHDQGIALYDQVSHVWTDYPSDLPVTDACYLNGNEFLVIMGCGTDSDGLYTFDPESGNFDVVTYLECPNFIAYDETMQKYYIGHHLGLETSTDGMNWSPVDTFNNMNIVSMVIYQNHIVLTQMDNIYSVWHSSDHGGTWVQSPPGGPMISDLGFDHEQKLYGISPDQSWSSGLWSSDDYGYSWDVEFYSVNVKCVGVDVMGDVFVGWDENSGGGDEGIAHYDPVSGTCNFINEGLSSLVINDICINPMMSSIALFCCTDSGAYISHDYVGWKEEHAQFVPQGFLKVYPNPARDFINVFFIPERHAEALHLQILQPDGRKIFERTYSTFDNPWDIPISDLSSGLYFLVIQYNGYLSSGTFIKQ